MSIGKWFEQAGKDIGKFVSKEVPKFFNETIPSVGKAETYRPSLVPLRKREAVLKNRLSSARTLFFDEKAQLADKTARYRAMSEDYKARFGDKAANTKIKIIKDAQWDDPASAAEKTWRDVDESVRTVFGSITLGLSESLWAPAVAVRAKQEKDFLEKQNTAYVKVIQKIDTARQKMSTASRQLDQSIEELNALDATVSELATQRNENALSTARTDAVSELALKMLRDGATSEQVEILTGLSANQVATLAARAKSEESSNGN